MDISQAQKLAEELLAGVRHPRLGAFIGLSEEVGELANEIMQTEIYGVERPPEKMEGEVADVLLSLLEVCTHYNIDLETAFTAKIEDIRTRVPEWEKSFGPALASARKKLD